MSTIGQWSSSRDRDSNTTYWTNSETGAQISSDSPYYDNFVASLKSNGNAFAPPALEENQSFQPTPGVPGTFDPATGQAVAINPYTTQRAQLEKMLVTSGPRAGQYLYMDQNGNSAYGLNAFNQATGNHYTDDQIPTSSTQLDIAKMNDSSGFANQLGDVIGDTLMGATGFIGGPSAALLGSFAADPSGDAASQRQDRALGVGALAGSIYGGLSGNGGVSTNGSYISDASNVEGTGTALGGSSGGALSAGSAGADQLNTGGNMGTFDGSGVDQFGNPTGEFVDTGQLSSVGSGDFFNPGFDATTSGGTDYSKYLSALGKLFSGSGSSNPLLGAGLGALLGSLGGGNKPAGTTTTIQDIPDWQKALLMPALGQSFGLLQQQMGQTSPLLGPAQNTLQKTISGDFLNSNPYLDATYNQAAKAVTDNYNSVVRPQNDAMFYKAGAFGPSNSAYDETVSRNQFGLGQNLNNLATNIYGGNYAQERQNQLNASGLAPSFAQSAQSTQFQPFKDFMSVAGGNFGGNTQQPYFQNQAGNIFGGALLGSQLFK